MVGRNGHANQIIAARHEIAHDLSFLHLDVEFDCVTIDAHAGGRVHIYPQRANRDAIGNIKAVGPAVEFHHRLSQSGVDRDRLLSDKGDGWRLAQL